MAEYPPESPEMGTGERPAESLAAARERADTPCLQWVPIDEPNRPVAIAEDDDVLDTYFDPEFGAWEALVLVQPEAEDQS